MPSLKAKNDSEGFLVIQAEYQDGLSESSSFQIFQHHNQSSSEMFKEVKNGAILNIFAISVLNSHNSSLILETISSLHRSESESCSFDGSSDFLINLLNPSKDLINSFIFFSIIATSSFNSGADELNFFVSFLWKRSRRYCRLINSRNFLMVSNSLRIHTRILISCSELIWSLHLALTG